VHHQVLGDVYFALFFKKSINTRITESTLLTFLAMPNVVLLTGCILIYHRHIVIYKPKYEHIYIYIYIYLIGRVVYKKLKAVSFNHIYLKLSVYGLTDGVFHKTICPACLIQLSCFVFNLKIHSLSLHLFLHPRHVLTMLSCCSRRHGQLLHVTQILSCFYTCFTVPIAITL